MRKIPTIFLRDHNSGFVRPEINPSAAWVFDKPVVAVRKYDGTCMLHNHGKWYYRRVLKPGQKTPMGFGLEEFDEVTKKAVGWMPVEMDFSYKKHFEQAVSLPPLNLGTTAEVEYEYGTYELIGPKVNGNPEGVKDHRLVPHKLAEQLADVQVLDVHELDVTDAYEALKHVLGFMPVEGAIFRHEDGRLAKLKKKDFPHV